MIVAWHEVPGEKNRRPVPAGRLKNVGPDISSVLTGHGSSLSCPGNELPGYFHEVPLGQITLACLLLVLLKLTLMGRSPRLL